MMTRHARESVYRLEQECRYRRLRIFHQLVEVHLWLFLLGLGFLFVAALIQR